MGISLEKGQKISLEKSAGTVLTKVMMGLGWDTAKKGGLLGGLLSGGGAIDLDASCVMFGGDNKVVDTVWFRQLKSRDGSIVHTGDNRTGDGDGDDEQIIVNLANIPGNVKSLVFTVNSYTGQTFDAVANAYCRLVNAENQKEIARYSLSGQGSHTAQIMAKLYRHNGEWKMHAIGDPAQGRTIEQLTSAILSYL